MMEQKERLDYLLDYLCREHCEPISMSDRYEQKRVLLRKLVNARPPHPVSDDFIKIQDDFLHAEARQRGIVQLTDIPPHSSHSRISLWQGDITRLEVGAIVNAANSKMLGCFVPGHHCIDNAIHTFAGVQLRQACYELMRKQEHDEPAGTVKITSAYNLPCQYVLHTVGPVVEDKVTEDHTRLLSRCYTSCLGIAEKSRIKSIAFCCISTGVFKFPRSLAAHIAVDTVQKHLRLNKNIERVIFDVFTDDDYLIYDKLLG